MFLEDLTDLVFAIANIHYDDTPQGEPHSRSVIYSDCLHKGSTCQTADRDTSGEELSVDFAKHRAGPLGDAIDLVDASLGVGVELLQLFRVHAAQNLCGLEHAYGIQDVQGRKDKAGYGEDV